MKYLIFVFSSYSFIFFPKLVLLTVLFRQHLGYVGASQEAHNANVLLTRGVHKDDLDLIFIGIRRTRLQMALRVFFVSTEFWVCEDLVGQIIRFYFSSQTSCPKTSLDEWHLLDAIFVTTTSLWDIPSWAWVSSPMPDLIDTGSCLTNPDISHIFLIG